LFRRTCNGCRRAFALCGWAILLAFLLFFQGGCGQQPLPEKKVLILGFDGMDPTLLERWMDEGHLPNFDRLRKSGDYKPLATSNPPMSPIAWSDFITGMNPGGHGIFDFIHRHPETLTPYLSTSETETASTGISLGSWRIPLRGGSVRLLRQGKAFWELLQERGIPCTILRIPANYPPIDTKARQLSGMGTPDIEGTYGSFSFYTDEPEGSYGEVSGGRVFYVKFRDSRAQVRLLGPPNPFRRDSSQSYIDFSLAVDTVHPVARIEIQDQPILLQQGEWSDWVRVKFPLVPYIQNVSGICRFYLKEVSPDFKLYVTPVNLDPGSPALPIGTPRGYSEELCEQIGLFYTQGIPEDTKALSARILNDEEFLQQTAFVRDEELRMFEYELSRFDSGLFFYYMGRPDQLQHMFWRSLEPDHPAHSPEAARHSETIRDVYREMDEILGKALLKVDERTTLIVLSDHGFASFARAFSINDWLEEQGYTARSSQPGGGPLDGFDWGKTKAYGLGFAGLYLNMKNREKFGLVQPGAEADQLLAEIAGRLLEVRDPDNGEQVILKVYRPQEIYQGPYVKDAPDLVIGYNRGYRAASESVLGLFMGAVLQDNRDKWSGDHLMEASLVPGILLSNRKIKRENPALHDLAPTVLAEFDLEKEPEMVGENLFE
jgi:predicted AlkP superfamily phosphohydrolase/phosphomutase